MALRASCCPEVPRHPPPAAADASCSRRLHRSASVDSPLPAPRPVVSNSDVGAVPVPVVVDRASPFPPLVALPLPRAYNQSVTVRVGLRNVSHREAIEAVRVRLLQFTDAQLYKVKGGSSRTVAYADYFIAYPPLVSQTPPRKASRLVNGSAAVEVETSEGGEAERVDPLAFPFPHGLLPGHSLVFDVLLKVSGTLRYSEDFASELPLPTVQTHMLRSETALDILLIRRKKSRIGKAGVNPWYIDPDLDHSRLFYSDCAVHIASVVDHRDIVPPLPQVYNESVA